MWHYKTETDEIFLAFYSGRFEEAVIPHYWYSPKHYLQSGDEIYSP